MGVANTGFEEDIMDFKRAITVVLCVCATSAIMLTASCGQSDNKPASTLTKAQRDSVLAASQIPGASVVGRALEVSDSANARAQRTDNSAP